MARAFLVPLTVGRPVGHLSRLHDAVDRNNRLLQSRSYQGRLIRLRNVYDRCRHIQDSHFWRWNVLSMGLTTGHILAVGLPCCVAGLSLRGMEDSVSTYYTSQVSIHGSNSRVANAASYYHVYNTRRIRFPDVKLLSWVGFN